MKGKLLAIFIHFAGLTLGLSLLYGIITLMFMFDMVESWLIAPATVVSVIFYFVMLVIVTARVLNGTDTFAQKLEHFIENK
jgi:hypothetical protein